MQDLRPLTIRQSWELRELEFARRFPPPPSAGAAASSSSAPAGSELDGSTRRALLGTNLTCFTGTTVHILTQMALVDLATCHAQPVDTRVAVLGFLTEALSSQPGLADWLFDSGATYAGVC